MFGEWEMYVGGKIYGCGRNDGLEEGNVMGRKEGKGKEMQEGHTQSSG